MTEARKYVVFGYFGGWNSGDEAILESVRYLLLKKHPEAEVAAICTRVSEAYAQHYQSIGVRVVTARKHREVRDLLKTHQLIIGGGQIITGDRSYKGLLFLIWLIWQGARSPWKPRMVGIGVEGVHRFFAKWLCRRITARADRVGCRDEYSQAMLRDAGCPTEKLVLTADVVLSSVIRANSENVPDDNSKPIAIGLHHSPLRHYAGAAFYRDLASKIREAFPKRPVVLVSNDIRENFDAGLLNQLAGQFDDEKVLFQHFSSLYDVVGTYASAACVISVRMHPLILALTNNVPVIGVGRSNKVQHLARRVGFSLYVPDQTSDQELIDMIGQCIDRGAPDLGELSTLARENFSGI